MPHAKAAKVAKMGEDFYRRLRREQRGWQGELFCSEVIPLPCIHLERGGRGAPALRGKGCSAVRGIPEVRHSKYLEQRKRPISSIY